ncbi:MAG: haloacid dehalogenase type II [Acetobacteraceae bacterium]
MRLQDFRVLTFDCYGTLIDWESGIFAALGPLLARVPLPPSRNAVLEDFARRESEEEARNPTLRYPALLAKVHHHLAEDWGIAPDENEARRFGASVPDWPPFPDSPAALAELERHCQLVILSNVDRASFGASNRRLGVAFDAVFTAEEIGSYKPDPANFRYLVDHLAERGVRKEDILHTAQSLYHDHLPAKRAGLATAWIDRRHDREGFGATPAPSEEVRTDFRFPTLAAMAEAWRTG